jgi:hypothetical protein
MGIDPIRRGHTMHLRTTREEVQLTSTDNAVCNIRQSAGLLWVIEIMKGDAVGCQERQKCPWKKPESYTEQ